MNTSQDSTLPAILGGAPVRAAMPVWPVCDEGVHAAVTQLLHSGDWGKYHAEHTRKLVEQLRMMFQAEYVCLTCSGTAAIEIALRAVGVDAGDEVILSAYDYKPNFTNVRYLRATPVLVDCRHDDGQIDIEAVPTAISTETKAVLISHLHGGMVDISALRGAIPDDIAIIEDACQMPGATYNGVLAGLSGDLGVISFGGSKTLSAGRGGAILTNNAQLAQRCRMQLERGNSAYPLSEMQAAVLVPQLSTFADRHQKRIACAEQLQQALAPFPFLNPFPHPEHSRPDYYKFGMFYDAATLRGLTREHFVQAIRAEGIPVGPGFAALQVIHHRKTFRQVGELINATHAGETIVGLHHPFLLEHDTVAQLTMALDKLAAHVTMVQQHFAS